MPLAEDIMVKRDRVVTFHPDDDVSYVAQTFYKKNISGSPVVDLEDRLIGVISELDIIELVKKSKIERLSQAKGFMEKTKVSEIMTKKVFTASPKASLTELAGLMFKKDVNRIPIVDKNGKLLGLVTRDDLLRGVYSQIEQR
ncbi:MAG: CBS domain-containing protein [archaeon]|nr:CBS domain-containing protein [archaeon]MCP8305927.1 CBS domain-containing protein [archaeon]